MEKHPPTPECRRSPLCHGKNHRAGLLFYFFAPQFPLTRLTSGSEISWQQRGLRRTLVPAPRDSQEGPGLLPALHEQQLISRINAHGWV